MATLVARSGMRRADDIFFTAMSLLMLVIVLVGFAPSYFLRGAVFAHLPSLLVHLHGAVFSTWIILFVIQSSLISAGNIRLHRKLGVLGAVVAGLMVVLGVLAPFGTLRRAAVLPSFFTPASFLIGNVIGILIFGAFVAVAICKRNNPKVHKRIMFIANTMLMPPALGRMPFMDAHPYLIGLIPLGMILALFVFDLFTWRRPLAVTVIGGLIFFVSNPIMDAVVHTSFAERITIWAQHNP
jgi:MFS family permease